MTAGTPARAIAADISPRLAQAALAAVVDDRLVDLTYPLTKDARVRIVTDKSPEALPLYRHSTAHLLAAAVTALFPGAQCGIGPAIDEGFFYDFVVDRAVRARRTSRPSKRRCGSWRRRTCSTSGSCGRARKRMDFFTPRGEPLKVQLIEEKTAGQSHVSCYTIKDRDTFVDFCVGPHVPSTGRLKAFKLTTTSNAYWKGDAKNQPMQRVYGTAFLSQKDLDAAPAAPRGGEEARPPEGGQGARALHASTPGRPAPPSGWPRARRSTTRWPTTCAACSSPPATSR